MNKPLITITTPTIRPEMIKIVADSLKKQDFQDYEWLIGTRANLVEEIQQVVGDDIKIRVLPEPAKRDGDFYNLNKCWNMLFREAKGELIVNIVDGLWFPSDALSTLTFHFEDNPKACITTIGNQYAEIIKGKPEVMIWEDPRGKLDNNGSFYETYFTEMELCLASLPHQAILECSGIQEIYDQGAAMGEKTMCLRLEALGYKMFIDKSIQYRSLWHDRIGGSQEWDKHYKIACALFDKHFAEIKKGIGLKGDL